MEKRATLVCNAVVESIVKTSMPAVDQRGEARMEARLKILHVFKGTGTGEITYYYRASGGWDPPNGPSYVNLEKGKRYRFFLVAGRPADEFTDVEWGAMDEVFGVEPLGDAELDNSPPLKRDEAIRLAIASVHVNPADFRELKKSFVLTWVGPRETIYDVYLEAKNGRSCRVRLLSDRTANIKKEDSGP